MLSVCPQCMCLHARGAVETEVSDFFFFFFLLIESAIDVFHLDSPERPSCVKELIFSAVYLRIYAQDFIDLYLHICVYMYVNGELRRGLYGGI